MLLFVLGRQPEIGLAELNAVSDGRASLIAPEIAVVDQNSDQNQPNDNFFKNVNKKKLSRLGSIIKCAEVFAEISDFSRANLTKIATEKFGEVDGKITLGISIYGKKSANFNSTKLGLELKNILRTKNSVRLIPSSDNALNSATVFHNNLAGENIKKTELIFVSTGDGKILVGRTIFVQDIDAYTFRDRSRPKRDARVGMLPPKLAQTMINLTTKSAALNDKILLDPFCGTGVVLQEASLMGLNVYGTDLESRMIEYSDQNLAWLKQTHRIDFTQNLTVGDATNFTWQQPLNFVATETYLGRPYASAPDEANLRENIANCDLILTKFLKNLSQQVKSDAGICVAVPCWFVKNRTIHLKLIDNLSQIGFEQIFYSANREPLIYHRENQVVGRELLVLRKKS
ncbi:MAG: hypothetical protein LBM09_02765 [Candidatus Nomurabacteria bacterium]|jgi:tRNA (guanine10-N2)-dimethyltransferase|nr:hypothetical protein [Candidatus Nomurabacteria bacterium]